MTVPSPSSAAVGHLRAMMARMEFHEADVVLYLGG